MLMRAAVFLCLKQAGGWDDCHGGWYPADGQEKHRPFFRIGWTQTAHTGPVLHYTEDMNQMERKEKGMLYRVDDPEIRKLQNHQLVLLADYNRMDLADWTSRRALLMELFASFGKDSFVEGRIDANWGGYFCHVGNHVYINFNLTMVDDGEIRIEDHVMIGPGVTLISGSHPNDPMLRKDLWQYTDPVRIGENAWIGAGAIVLPGVSIGRDSIIGAGSVVTHSVPDGCVAAGNPCRVIRRLGEKDRRSYGRGCQLDEELKRMLEKDTGDS